MKHYRLNQIAMAVLGALLLIFGTKTLINIAFEEHKPEEHEAAKHEEKAAPAPGSDLPALLAKADAAKGETDAAVCKVCHSFDKGQPSPIGPNLHDVVGRKIASVEGFNYTPALKAHAGEVWTYENLNHWITNPQAFASGTTMAFPGLPDAQQRADVILFLRSKTDNPPPLPEVVAAAPAAEAAKPAEGAAKPGGEPAPGGEILPLLAKADPKKGEGDVALCKVCHSFEKGAPSPIGPNLYGVVGRKIASVEGFAYSPALKGKATEGDWTFEHLDLWLTNPQAFAAGTVMAFPGLPDLATRADVIAFLRTKSDNPVPLPEAAAPAAAPAEAAPAPKAEEPAPTAAPEAPKAEEPAPAAAPEAPKAEEAPPAPAAETPTAPAPAAETPAEPAPTAETPAAPAPSAETPAEPAPATETPAAVEPSAETPAETTPSDEAAEPGPASDADTSEPSTATQPQTAYPEGEPQ
jgi:cytochrome c2